MQIKIIGECLRFWNWGTTQQRNKWFCKGDVSSMLSLKLSFLKFMKLTRHRGFVSDRFAYFNNIFLFNVFLITISNTMETQFQIQYEFCFSLP